MSVSAWKYVKTLNNKKDIKRFEEIIHKVLPSDYKEIVGNYNGGRPDKSAVMLQSKREVVFKTLLSFNKEDKENIFAVYDWVGSQLQKGLIPFAIDPAGNYFCFDYNNNKNGSVVFWNHENQQYILICNTFTQLLENMY
ncbi:MAG: SMI1/KNR4 family protein [Dehalobacter sp. 4CP]|nr:SMI1/KNR4 family protein [Dehalobacter sp. 4CP]